MSRILGAGFVSSVAALIVLSGASVALAGSTANHSTNDKITVVTKVKVRGTANGTQLGTQSAGSIGTIIGGPIVEGGYTWWNIDYSTGVDGWSAEDFIQMANVAIYTPKTSATAQVASAASASDAVIASLQAQLTALLAQIAALKGN